MVSRGIIFANATSRAAKLSHREYVVLLKISISTLLNVRNPRPLNLVCEEKGPEAGPSGSVTGIAAYRGLDAFAYMSANAAASREPSGPTRFFENRARRDACPHAFLFFSARKRRHLACAALLAEPSQRIPTIREPSLLSMANSRVAATWQENRRDAYSTLARATR